MQIEALVMKGAGKERCEDRFLMGRTVLCDIDGHTEIDPPYMAAVADGVGGNGNGDLASGYLCQCLAEADLTQIADSDGLRAFLQAQNEKLIKMASGIRGAYDMATTFTGILINERGGWLINAGNGRVYTMESGHLHQLTHDQTTYEWLMSAGRQEEARRYNRNEITCCFGNANINQLAQLEIIPLYDFSALLITSDGIHGSLSAEQMESVLNHASSPADACRALCRTAENFGSRDDMTVALVY